MEGALPWRNDVSRQVTGTPDPRTLNTMPMMSGGLLAICGSSDNNTLLARRPLPLCSLPAFGRLAFPLSWTLLAAFGWLCLPGNIRSPAPLG